MARKVAVVTLEAPQAIGPYSQAIRVGEMIFLSGQIPLDPKSGQMVEGGVVEQTERVIQNLVAVLAKEKCTLANLVKTTVFLKSMGDFPKFNEVYQKHFVAPYPARATVEVAALPKGALVEIEGIAICE